MVIEIDENQAKSNGFRDATEAFRLISTINTSEPEVLQRLEDWQKNDGSKVGLHKLAFPSHPI